MEVDIDFVGYIIGFALLAYACVLVYEIVGLSSDLRKMKRSGTASLSDLSENSDSPPPCPPPDFIR